MTAGTASTTHESCDQRTGGDGGGGGESPADAAVASLPRASILNHAILDPGIRRGWWGGRSLNGH